MAPAALLATVWRLLHLTSVAGVVLAGVHGFQMGSDATTVVFEAGLVVAAALVVYAVGCGCSALCDASPPLRFSAGSKVALNGAPT